jgi:hypothetical protein
MPKGFTKWKERFEMTKIYGWMEHLYPYCENLTRMLLSPPSGVGPM